MDDFRHTLSPVERYILFVGFDGLFAPEDFERPVHASGFISDYDDAASCSSSTITNPPTVYEADIGVTSARWYAAHEELGEYDDGPYIFPTAAERALEFSYFGSCFSPL